MIGFDTSIIIDLFKGNNSAKDILENLKKPIAVTMMSYLELFFGLDLKNQQHIKEGEVYDEFFRSVHIINLNSDSCKKASKIFWDLKKEGKTIEQFDCVIAAMFMNEGINKIVTKNSKHFERIRSLQVISY